MLYLWQKGHHNFSFLSFYFNILALNWCSSHIRKKSKYIIIWWQAMCICKTYNITIAEVIEFFAFKLVCYVFCCFVCCILNLILILKINHIDETSEVWRGKKMARANGNRQLYEQICLRKTVYIIGADWFFGNQIERLLNPFRLNFPLR